MTHWKKLTNPDYLGAYSIEDGKDLILTIAYVRQEKVIGTDGKKEDCIVCHFSDKGAKPMILNVTNCKTISKLYGTPLIEEWAGKRIQIGIEKVKAFGDVVEALRVRAKRPPEPKGTVYECADCGKTITDFDKFSAVQIAAITQKRYGVTLCSECSTKRKNAESGVKQDEADNG